MIDKFLNREMATAPLPITTGYGRVLLGLTFFTITFLILNGIALSGSTSDDLAGPGAIKAHHFFSALLALFLALRARIPRLPLPVIIFIAYSLLVTAVASFFVEQSSQFVNLIYCYVLVSAFSLAGRILGTQKLVLVFRAAFIFSLSAVLIKNAFAADEIRSFIYSGGRVWVRTLVGGGVNQEGALLALGATLFIGSRYFYPYLFLATLVNLLYTSRGGVLICVAVYLLSLHLSGKLRTKGVVGALAMLFVSIIGIHLASEIGLVSVDHIVERFLNSDDKGNLGRLSLWEGARVALGHNIWGYGVMNAVPTIERLAGMDFVENNLHNIYLQVLVDTGVIGFLCFALMVLWIFRKVLAGKGDVFGYFLIMYFIFGFIRFRGYDPFAFMLIGAFHSALLASPAVRVKLVVA